MKKIILCLLILTMSISFMSACSKDEKRIVIAAKDYTEQDILGYILTGLVENNTDIKVTFKHEMTSNIIFAAIQSGDIDLYADYTGTVYANYLGYSEIKPADEIYDISVKELKEKYNITMLDPLGFNNTYCIAVREDTAEKYNIKTFSDLAKVSQDFIFGGGFEILNRSDGIPVLKQVYNMNFKQELAIEGALRYTSIQNDETQVTEAYSTDGMLMEYNLVVLEDDKNFFPPYHAAVVIKDATAEKYPELIPVLNKLTGTLNDDSMRELNYKVDVLKQNPKTVADEFLKSAGLIE